MTMTNKDFDKLLHDLKRIEHVIKIIIDEESIEKRKVIGSLLMDEFDRLYEDIVEVKNSEELK